MYAAHDSVMGERHSHGGTNLDDPRKPLLYREVVLYDDGRSAYPEYILRYDRYKRLVLQLSTAVLFPLNSCPVNPCLSYGMSRAPKKPGQNGTDRVQCGGWCRLPAPDNGRPAIVTHDSPWDTEPPPPSQVSRFRSHSHVIMISYQSLASAMWFLVLTCSCCQDLYHTELLARYGQYLAPGAT